MAGTTPVSNELECRRRQQYHELEGRSGMHHCVLWSTVNPASETDSDMRLHAGDKGWSPVIIQYFPNAC